MSTDDLSPLFRRKPSPGARFGQGKLLAWDPDTFSNVVKWQGVELRNLPVLAGVEALTFAEADSVVLVGWDQSGRRGTQDWAIWSRAIIPGTGAAEQAIAWMQTTLASAISAAVFSDRIHSADADGQVNISHTVFSFVSAAGGPTLTAVPITSAGRAIVFASASIGTDAANPATEIRGFMSYEVSGASTVSPVTRNALNLDFRNDVNENAAGLSASRASLLTGLNEGLHDFEAKYQVTAFGASDESIFLFRNLTVIAF